MNALGKTETLWSHLLSSTTYFHLQPQSRCCALNMLLIFLCSCRAARFRDPVCRGGEMGDLGLGCFDGGSVLSLLLQSHDLESLKVREVGSGLSGGELLGPRGRIPLGLYTTLLPCLGEGGGSCGPWEACDDVWGEGQVVVCLDVTGHAGRWAIDEGSVVVDDLRDDGERTCVWSDGEVDNSADLHESLETFVLRLVSSMSFDRLL